MLTTSVISCLTAARFSAWRKGIDLPIQEYIEYCKRHKDEVDFYVNLDCIPGEAGKMDSSQESIEFSAGKSYSNLQIMKDAGLAPVPVFHQGERFEWLEKMINDGETYIGISPYMRAHQNEIIKWMDRCFSLITDDKGRPIVKTHGFGVTACNLCVRYPWTSVDSTSWSVGGGYGSILVPQYISGKPDYTRPPLTLRISARAADQSRGFDGLPAAQQDAVRQAVIDAGVTMSELRNTFMGRWKMNIQYHLGMAASCDGKLFTNRAQSLFGGAFKHNKKGYQPQPLKMYFATVVHTNHHNEFLNANNITNRLLSYAFLRELDDSFLMKYRTTGLPEYKEPRPKKANLKHFNSEVYRVRRATAAMRMIQRKDNVDIVK